MLIDVTEVLLNFKNQPILQDSDDDDKPGEPFTVRDAIFLALNTYGPNYVPSAKDKADSFEISCMIYAGPTAEFTIEQAAFIKEKSGNGSTTALVHGRLCEVLENAAQITPETSTIDA